MNAYVISNIEYQAKKEIRYSLPNRLYVELDKEYNNNEIKNKLAETIHDITGCCVNDFKYDDARDWAVSKLNNSMEEDEFWCKEFECKKDEIVVNFGFGYSNNDENISYVDGDNIIKLIIPLDEICSSLFKLEDASEIRQYIFWIYENNN